MLYEVITQGVLRHVCRSAVVKPDRFFKALSDRTRLRILMLLSAEGELCVCELTHALAIPQPKASKHLAILRAAGLVRMRRDAQWSYNFV